MKLILVIAGVLAILALAQARPQDAEGENDGEAIEIPSELEEEQEDQEESGNENPEVPHLRPRPHSRPHWKPQRPHIQRNGEFQRGQQQPSQNEGHNPSRGPHGRLAPRPHRRPHFGQRPELQPEPEQDPNQDDIDNPESIPVLLDGNGFSILNDSGNDNTIINAYVGNDDNDNEEQGN